jgi:hypothetical protein
MQVIRRVVGTMWLACVAVALSLPGAGLAGAPVRSTSPVACTTFKLTVEPGSPVATNNSWGSAFGPGPDPSDTVCTNGSPVTTTPFATTPFSVKAPIKR